MVVLSPRRSSRGRQGRLIDLRQTMGVGDMSNSDRVVVEPRVNRRQVLIGAGAAASAAAVGLATSVVPASADSRDESWILGAWDITVTSDGNGAPPPFPGVIGFAVGGVMTEVDGNTPQASVGGWKGADDGEVKATFRNFSFDNAGNLQGVDTVNVTLHSTNDGKGFAGNFKFTATDPSGSTVFFTGTGHVVGTRLVIHGA
jgi:hypothetical protein